MDEWNVFHEKAVEIYQDSLLEIIVELLPKTQFEEEVAPEDDDKEEIPF